MKNELKESKISLLDKIKWRIKYRELSSVLGSDTPLMRGIIKNKTIEEGYQEHKSDIIDYLKRIKEKMPDKMEDAENIMVQTIYDDYMRSAFQSNRTEESMIKPINAYEIDESVANFSELLNNLDYMLWIGDKDKDKKQNQNQDKNQAEESKISLLDKMTWRIKYRELSSVLGSDPLLTRGISKNKILEQGYQKHKSDIIFYLKRIKEQMPDKMEDAKNIIVQTIYDEHMERAFSIMDESIRNFSKLLNYELEYMLSRISRRK